MIKRVLGIVWMLLGPIVLFLLIRTALGEMARNPSLDTRIQWGVFILVFIPIGVGLIIFGYYAFKGEYEDNY